LESVLAQDRASKLNAANLGKWNLWLAFIWLGAAIPTLSWWKESILWVAFMSLWANVASHFAAWIAARAEQSVEEANDNG
jgi:hypothetical protein